MNTPSVKEPFYTSVRFWVAVLTPVVAALLPELVKAVPFLADLKPENVTAVVASWVVVAATYILARTFRNTKTK